MEELMTRTRKIGNSNYEVASGDRTFRVRREWDGELKGLWVVTEQNAALKANGVDHWFRKGVEASKRDAIRLIDGGHYAT
jgi:hypothetical protein